MTKDAIDQARSLQSRAGTGRRTRFLKESNKGVRVCRFMEPFGDLVLTFEKEREITAYERSLDPGHGVCERDVSGQG